MNITKPSDAEWTRYEADDPEEVRGLQELPELHSWTDRILSHHQNFVSASSFPDEETRLDGTIIVSPDPMEPQSRLRLSYYVTPDAFVTVGLAALLSKLGLPYGEKAHDRHKCPIEGLMHILNLLLDYYFRRMDEFELQLHDAKSTMRKSNDGYLFRFIMDLRYNLLHWNDQITQLKEIRYAVEEVFGEEAASSRLYEVLKLRLERISMLQQEYRAVIDSLLSLDGAIINYRANDIMKTLTVFTVLLTPMTALGAVWGMNFENMPELQWKWAYPAAYALMFSIMAIIYWYLRRQGWTGSILKDKKTPKKRQPRTE